MTTITQTGTQARSETLTIMPIVLAASAGLFLILFSGFAKATIIHDAAHDTRHTLAFPCH